MGRAFRDRLSRATRESDSSGVSVVTIPRAHFARNGGGGGGGVSSYAGQHFNHQHRNSGDRRPSGTPGLLHLATCTGGGGFGGGGLASSSSARSDRESVGSSGGLTGRDVRSGFHLPPRFRRQPGAQEAYPYAYENSESCTGAPLAQWTANTNRCSSRAAAVGGGCAPVTGTGVAPASRDRDRERDRERGGGGGEKERDVVGNKLSGGDSGKESQLSSDSGEANNSCCPEARADATHAVAGIVSSAPPAPSAQTQFSFFYGPSYAAAAAEDASAAATTARMYPAAATNDSAAHEHVPEGRGNESSKPMLMGQRNEAASSSSNSSSSHSRSHSKPADLVDGAGCAPDAAVSGAPEQQQLQPRSRPPSNSNAAHPPALLPTPAGTASDSSITRVPLAHPKQSLSLSHSHNAVAITTRATPNATAIDRNAALASASGSLGVTGMHSAVNLPGAAVPLHQLKLPPPQPQPQPKPNAATISALQYLSTCNLLGQSALAPNNANAAAAASLLQQQQQLLQAALLQAAAGAGNSAALTPIQALTALAMNQQRAGAGGGLIAAPSAPPLLSAAPLMHAQFPFMSTAAALNSAALAPSVALNRSLSVQQFLPAAAVPTGMAQSAMLDSSLGKGRIGAPSSTSLAPSLAKFQLGDECEALYAGDHNYYRAIVVRMSHLGAYVVFPEYGPEMYEVPLEHLRSFTPPVTPSSGAARAPASSTPLLRGAPPAAGAATPSCTSAGGSCGAASFTVNGSSNASSASLRFLPASDSPPSQQQQQTAATAKLDLNTSA